jgi:hypothetical protein
MYRSEINKYIGKSASSWLLTRIKEDDLMVHITNVDGIRNLVKVWSGKLILDQLGHLERECVCGKVDIRDYRY